MYMCVSGKRESLVVTRSAVKWGDLAKEGGGKEQWRISIGRIATRLST